MSAAAAPPPEQTRMFAMFDVVVAILDRRVARKVGQRQSLFGAEHVENVGHPGQPG